MSAIEKVLRSAHRVEQSFPYGGLGRNPSAKLAMVVCMDSRIDVFALFGLGIGEAHILRNPGGQITDAEIRALALSQHRMGTREVLLVHHTDCGAYALEEEAFKDEIERACGIRPTWSNGGFSDLETDVARSVRSVRQSPFLLYRDSVRGFIYDVVSGELREVIVEEGSPASSGDVGDVDPIR